MNAKRHAQSVSPRVPDLLDAGLTSSDDLVALAESTSEPFTPEMVLFVDDTEESRRARQLLVESGEEFRTIPAQGWRIPAVVFGGIVAERLAGVRGLLRALGAFDTSFQAGITERPLRPTPRTE